MSPRSRFAVAALSATAVAAAPAAVMASTYVVRPGDTLHVRATVLEARRSNSKPDRGVIRSAAEVTNQHGETVMRVTAINFVRLRDPGA